MKSKLLYNAFSGSFLLLFLMILLYLCSIINAVKYKTMILTVNSKSYLNSREKMNKMLEKYKYEITKLKEINNKLNQLSGTLIIPKIIKKEKSESESKAKIIFDKNIKSDHHNNKGFNEKELIANNTVYDRNGSPVNEYISNNMVNQNENFLGEKNKTVNKTHFSVNLNISTLKNELISDFFSEKSISLEINLLNEVFIEKFNLTTKKFDCKNNKIKLPEFSKEGICYIDLNDNKSLSFYNEKYEEADRKAKKLKEAKAVFEKEQNTFSAINILQNPFTMNLKVNENLSNERKSNSNKLKENFNKDILKYSFLKIQEIIENIIPYSNNSHSLINNPIISHDLETIESNKTLMPENNVNTTLTENSTKIQAQRLIYLSYPETSVVEKIINFFKLIHKDYKKDVCNTCFNHIEFLQNLKIKISLAIQEIKDILLKPIRKSELIEYFSDKVNNVNLIKLNLENLRDVIKLQKEFGCEDYETINKYYEGSLKAANYLVEAIQNSIRKLNLNISFLVIS